MYCPNCGNPVGEDNICHVCKEKEEAKETKKEQIKDEGSCLWWILGFLFPIIGFILFLVWLNDKPKSSKQAGIGCLVSVLLKIILAVLAVTLFFNYKDDIIKTIDETVEAHNVCDDYCDNGIYNITTNSCYCDGKIIDLDEVDPIY